MTRNTDSRKFNKHIEEARLVLLNPTTNSHDLFSLAWDINRFLDPFSENADISKVRDVIDILRLLRTSKGAGRGSFEEKVMESLCEIINVTSWHVKEAGIENLPPWEIPDHIALEIEDDLNITAELSVFAVECIEFIRPRDSLAGNRRRYAFEILGRSLRVFSMPQEIIDYAFTLIKIKKYGDAVAGALLFLEQFYEVKGVGIPYDIEEKLLKFVLRTDSRGLAVGALNILVEAGNICEVTALDHIDDWKERNYY